MTCRTIRIGMGQRFERIVGVRYVDSQDLFDNLDFNEEIEGTSARVSRFGITGGFFAARTSFWTSEATLV
jgi:hypothetical protein